MVTGLLGAQRQAVSPESMGQAFCDLISRYPQKLLPKMGGLNATVIVTVSEDSLMGRVAQAGVLDPGDRISPGLVLGGDSMPLDLGREKRLHTEAQRVAITLRDRTCRTVGCDRTGSLHIHDTSYDATFLPNGKVAFHRRP